MDFVIDNMTAKEFMDISIDYLKEKANVSGVGIIKSNPE